MSVTNRWSKLIHPSIISLHDCYLSNGAVFFVHEYYPSAISLYDRFLKVRGINATNSQNAVPGSAPVAEDVLWCVLIQLLSALQAIHAYGLSCRVVDCRHVLETTRNRYRIGSVGVMDVLEPRNNQQELQSQDLHQLGYVMMVLGSRGCTVTDMKTLSVRYSNHFVEVVQYLLQGQYRAQTMLEQCMPEVVKTVNSALSTNDYYYNVLVME